MRNKVLCLILPICLILVITLACSSSSTPEPSVSNAVDEILPSVVRIWTDYGMGSGVIIDESGYILTNNHVIEGAGTITVILSDENEHPAKILGRDEFSDLAVLEINEDNLTEAEFGKSSELKLGDDVIAVGFPLDLEGSATISAGIASAFREELGVSYIQTDTAINPGNSGGPLVNMRGEVVGINTFILQETEGLNFAIDIDSVESIIDRLSNGESILVEIPEQREWETYQNESFGYSVEYPDIWEVDDYDASATWIGSYFAGVEIDVYDATGWTLDDWVDDDIEIYYSDYYYFELISDQSIMQQGVQARKLTYVIESEQGAGEWQHVNLYILSGDTIYDVFCLVATTQYERYDEAFESIIDSFTLYNPEIPTPTSEPTPKPSPTPLLNPTLTPCLDTVVFPDPNLEAVIRQVIEKPVGDICQSDLDDIISLDGDYSDISDLSGLERCHYLNDLSLMGNQITDISPIAELTELTVLILGDNQISDLSPLADLRHLVDLALHINQIDDISHLSNLTKLKTLWFMGNQVSDVSALSNLNVLTALFLQDNHVTDLSPLSDLPSLTALEIKSNGITDILPLVENDALGEEAIIDLQGNPLSDTSLEVYIPQLEERGVMVFWGPIH